MVALKPGVAFLHDLFHDSGTIPTDIVLKSLDGDKATAAITETNKDALKLAECATAETDGIPPHSCGIPRSQWKNSFGP